MAVLTHSQLLLLDNLVYLKGITANHEDFPTVKDVIDRFFLNGEVTEDFKITQSSGKDGTQNPRVGQVLKIQS